MQSIARIGVIAALLVSFGWLFLRGGGETEALVGGLVRPAEGHESAPGLVEPLQVTEHREPAREAADPNVLLALESIHTASAKAGTFTFLGHLVSPDGQSLVVPELRASIIGPGSFRRTFEGRDVDSFQFDDVPVGAFRFVVEATGYHHRPLPGQLEFLGDDIWLSVVRSCNVTLWPVAWIQIVVRTRDGRRFQALAEDLDLEPKRLFVHAFRVAAGHEPFSAGTPLPPVENELAVFHIPQAYQSVSYPDGVACALELRAAPPLWVGLWVHGVFHEVQLLQATDTELLFEIDMAVLDASLARVRARLVDRDSGAPITDARATLKADTSAHRRLDLSNEVPDDMGLLTFERVIPGQHELTIKRDGHLVQRRITLSPAEDLDLGEIPIGSGPGLPIRVVDAEGRPVKAWIEIAPLEPGTYVGELYPPNLHRTTDGQGLFTLPVPERRSVVRARPIFLHGSYRQYADVGTRNMLVDPDHLPAELVLVAEAPVDLTVEPLTTWIEGQRVTFEAEHGLVIDQAGGENDGRLSANLVPGPYVVRRWEGDRELGSLDIVVTRDMRSVRCP